MLPKNSDILIEEKNEETEIVPKGAKIMNNNENKKNNKKEIKKINKNENTGIEIEKCDTNNRNIQKKINDNKKQRKYKCLFCCFNNNSFSDIEWLLFLFSNCKKCFYEILYIMWKNVIILVLMNTNI